MLEILLSEAIEGASSNAFRKIIFTMNNLPIEAKRLQFTLDDLRTAMIVSSNKWEKSIDDYLN